MEIWEGGDQLEIEKPTWMLQADPRRQATDPLRGYLYQAWQALFAWLVLHEDEVLYLEGAEDFDIVGPSSGTTVQVKDTSGKISLRTKCVTDAISNYWRLHQIHSDKAIRFAFLTRAKIGMERGSPFGPKKKGLDVWQQCSIGDKSVAELAAFLSGDHVVAKRIPPDLVVFLKTADGKTIYEKLLYPLKWFTEAPPAAAIATAIDYKLITHGSKQGILPSECTRVTDRLLREVLTVSCHKQADERTLVWSQFAILFEKETRISVSRRTIQEMQSALSMETQWDANQLIGMSPSRTSFVHVLSPGGPPPVPPNIAPRSNLVGQCQTILNEGHSLAIVGATGMGKTTLAKLTAIAQGGEWAWFSFTEYHGDRFAWALTRASAIIDDMPQQCCVLLDDLPYDPGTVKAWEQAYGSLIYTINMRRISMITTSRKAIPASVRNHLGVTNLSEITVPDLDEREIANLCIVLGCSAGQAETHAKVAYLHTLGHPQLVHARLLALSRQGWPPLSVDGLFATPDDVREQQQQTRQLLENLTHEEAELLYRASVALGPFRREHIIRLAELANLPRPGDLFDRLVGPWIERVIENYYELSPLLKNAGAEVWSSVTVAGIHSQLADVILEAKELSTVEGSHALFHAFIGKNASALAGLGMSLIAQGTDEVLKAFGGAAFWFLVARIDEESGALYDGDPALSLLLRMAQYRLCVSAEPEMALRVLDAWEREIVPLDPVPPNLLSRLLFLISGLLYVQVPMRPGRVLRIFEEFAALRQVMNEPKHRDFFESLPLESVDRDGKQMKLLATLFAMNGMRCRNKDDLLEMLGGLAAIDAQLRLEIMDETDAAIGYAIVYVDNAFLHEIRAETPDWSGLLSVMSATMDCAAEWGTSELGAHAARIAAIVLDEQCSRPNDALAILDSAAQRFHVQLPIIEGERGTILLHCKRYDEALSAFECATSLRKPWNADKLDVPIFSLRNAGIAAAHAGRWERAAYFFTQASYCASNVADAIMTAAFLTDAAFARWEAGDRLGMLDAMMGSIAAIDAMDISERDPGRLWVRRGTAHVLNWIHCEARGAQPPRDLEAPRAGMCSRSEYNEEIMALPDVPMDLMLYLLISLEHTLQAEPKARAQYVARLGHVTTPAVTFLMGQLQIHEALSSGALECLPVSVDKMARGYAAVRTVAEPEEAIYYESEVPISDAQIRLALADGGLLESILLAALLRGGTEAASHNVRALIERWCECGSIYVWADDLMAFLDAAESLQRSSTAENCRVMRNRQASHRDRQLAALYIAWDLEDVSLRDLLQAHVFLFEQYSRDHEWGGDVEGVVSEMISSTWSAISRSRFRLLTPAVTAPALEVACSIVPESYSKASAVLIAAADASGGRLPPELLRRYRGLSDGTAGET